MGEYISAIDIFGKTVTCSEDQWNNHIVNGHTIMENNKDAVIDTISSPDFVFESSYNSNRMIFIKNSCSSTYYNSLLTKVIVQSNNDKEGEIVTAFPIKKIKGGIGNVVYPT